MRAPLLTNLKQPVNSLWALAIAVVLFDGSFYLMSTLFGEHNQSCEIGAALTEENIAFAALFSILTGIMVSGLITLYRERSARRDAALATSLTGIGALIGTLTLFCTVCSLPLITLFGISSVLAFFSSHTALLQIASISILVLTLYFINQQLENKCAVCGPRSFRKLPR